PTDPGYRDLLSLEIGGRLDVRGDVELVRPDRAGVRDDDDIATARRCGERFGAADVRDLRLPREERRKPGRARDELQVDVEEVLVEDSRFFGDVRGEEIGETLLYETTIFARLGCGVALPLRSTCVVLDGASVPAQDARIT